MLVQTKLDYDFDVFLNADYSVHEGSCIAHQVHELQDVHEEEVLGLHQLHLHPRRREGIARAGAVHARRLLLL